MRVAWSLAFVTLLACSTSHDDAPSTPPPAPAPAPPDLAASDVFIVAHQDDDLLFLSPDLGNAIQAQGATMTVYVTAGDGGNPNPAYFLDRERGVQAAYAELAGVDATHWVDRPLVVRGHALHALVLPEAKATLVFLRLPDGGGDGHGFATSLGTHGGSLKRLHKGEIDELRTVDGELSYTRDDLVATLTDLLAAASPQTIRTLDGSSAFGNDHSDHLATALFAREAKPTTTSLMLYRGYNIAHEPENIEIGEADAKWRAFQRYAAFDWAICGGNGCNQKIVDGYHAYANRQYPMAPSLAAEGPIANGVGLCLDVAGTPPTGALCTDAATQRFDLTSTGRLVTDDGHCVVSHEGTVVVEACEEEESQRWTLLSSGTLMSDDGLCLAATTAGAPVALGSCERSPATEWAVRFATERAVSTDASLDAQSIFFGDVDGDGRADLCARTASMLSCTLRRHDGTFGSPAFVTDAFSEAHGFASSVSKASIALVDIDRDGRLDLCGLRDDARIVCARGLSGGATFANAMPVPGPTFPNEMDAFAFADVDGDGAADACYVAEGTVECALHRTGTTFAAATKWINGSIAPEVGFVRWAFADVNGDGRADICAVFPAHVDCAVASKHKPAFVRQRRWFTMGSDGSSRILSDFAFADVNGDRRADLCNLDANGVSCAISTRSGFGSLLPRIPASSTWRASRLALVDLDRNGKADACRWGALGLACSSAP